MERNTDLAGIMRSRYLRDERRYDKWGAQGKVLLLVEVLKEEELPVEGLPLERVVNSIFPRTFSCHSPDANPDGSDVKTFYHEVRELLRQEMDNDDAARVALEEAAEKFCTTVDRVEDLL